MVMGIVNACYFFVRSVTINQPESDAFFWMCVTFSLSSSIVQAWHSVAQEILYCHTVYHRIIEEPQLNLIDKENEMEILKKQNKVEKWTSSDDRASLSVIEKVPKTNTEKALEKNTWKKRRKSKYYRKSWRDKSRATKTRQDTLLISLFR
ncbi:hypothetical protein HHI36_001412 [Cryptolaemus montrouzieri]|uniref:Uncharacterized protein n=1 Tax=Cryptolaemus montrouzieri TaxID=559131 RepID=A0ABD2P7G7_9CUCU